MIAPAQKLDDLTPLDWVRERRDKRCLQPLQGVPARSGRTELTAFETRTENGRHQGYGIYPLLPIPGA
jgi:hypothetical protein